MTSEDIRVLVAKEALEGDAMRVAQRLHKIGLHLDESLFLRQIHYWNAKNEEAGRNKWGGFTWSWNSYEGWASEDHFPFWSVAKIKRLVWGLEDRGLLVTQQLRGGDRSKSYRVNYEALGNAMTIGSDRADERQDESIGSDRADEREDDHFATPIGSDRADATDHIDPVQERDVTRSEEGTTAGTTDRDSVLQTDALASLGVAARENPEEQDQHRGATDQGTSTDPGGSLAGWSFADSGQCVVCGGTCIAHDPHGRVRHPACGVPA